MTKIRKERTVTVRSFFLPLREYVSSFSQQFWLLCLCSFFYFFSFNLIIPQLSEVISDLGGAGYKGLIFGIFALSALISRPFSGKLVDHIGRKPVILTGISIAIAVTFLYPFVGTVFGFLVLRFAHGFSAGFAPTGTTGAVADLVPSHRRGEAMGMLGMLNNVGMSISPAFGSEVAIAFGNTWMFISSSAFAVLALLPYFWLKESGPKQEKFRLKHLLIKVEDLFEPLVKKQGLIMVLSVITFGAIITLVPDMCDAYGIKRRGYIFTAITIPSIAMRLFSGKWSDVFGREVVMVVGLSLLIVSNILFAMVEGPLSFFTAAVVFGLSTGVNSPTIFAWVVDKANPKFLGRGISTLFICLELGIIIGSVGSAFVYNNNPNNFKFAFLFCCIFSFGALYVVWKAFRKSK
ncbi:MAG: MFS family permease [Bacteroidia bacterium]|jgi:MFS family permease